jgi:hypothetical protein
MLIKAANNEPLLILRNWVQTLLAEDLASIIRG